MIACRLVLAKADIDLDPGGTQPRMALPADLGIGIFNGGYDPFDARGDDGIRAGRRFAEMLNTAPASHKALHLALPRLRAAAPQARREAARQLASSRARR